MHLQPLLHDLVTCVRAPTTVLSGRDGQVRALGAQGVFCADVRVLSQALLCLDGREPEPLVGGLDGPAAARFTSLDRVLGDRTPDPTVRLERFRVAFPGGVAERVVLTSTASAPVSTRVDLHVEVDLASVHDVKAGRPGPVPQPGAVADGGVTWSGPDGLRVEVRATPAVREVGGAATATPTGALLTWPLRLAPGARAELGWELVVTDPGAVVAAAPSSTPWTRPRVQADDARFPALVEQSLDDLDALRLALPGDGGAQFLAAGSPWFLTLFGRDSLWAARMALPLGTELAAGTLGALAARQGRRDDAATGEAPGKVLHELRRAGFAFGGPVGGEVVLPPVYYGTVDATLLWVVLLHDAWRWGLDPATVEALLPALEAAVGWMTGPAADPDGDGFLEYVDATGTGLSNQGWKDSGDALRFRDGSLARGPVALAEVQGYAFEAAGCAAALLTAFGRAGADALLAWQADLGARFRSSFWVEDADGAYPALALDGDKQRVDALTSNPGHLLGTGLLNGEEAGLVAARLSSPPLDGGFGLRTMSTSDAGFSPLSYHCGSVWPHDTAIAVSGLVREGFAAEAAGLLGGLLRAATSFEQRLPELFAGDASTDVRVPVPYPAACRPQAWSAAAGVSLMRDLLGLAVDVPGGVVRLDPLPHGPAGALRVAGLTVGDGTLDVEVDRSGAVVAASTTSGLRLERPAAG